MSNGKRQLGWHEGEHCRRRDNGSGGVCPRKQKKKRTRSALQETDRRNFDVRLTKDAVNYPSAIPVGRVPPSCAPPTPSLIPPVAVGVFNWPSYSSRDNSRLEYDTNDNKPQTHLYEPPPPRHRSPSLHLNPDGDFRGFVTPQACDFWGPETTPALDFRGPETTPSRDLRGPVVIPAFDLRGPVRDFRRALTEDGAARGLSTARAYGGKHNHGSISPPQHTPPSHNPVPPTISLRYTTLITNFPMLATSPRRTTSLPFLPPSSQGPTDPQSHVSSSSPAPAPRALRYVARTHRALLTRGPRPQRLARVTILTSPRPTLLHQTMTLPETMPRQEELNFDHSSEDDRSAGTTPPPSLRQQLQLQPQPRHRP